MEYPFYLFLELTCSSKQGNRDIPNLPVPANNVGYLKNCFLNEEVILYDRQRENVFSHGL